MELKILFLLALTCFGGPSMLCGGGVVWQELRQTTPYIGTRRKYTLALANSAVWPSERS